ncbi:oligosaccharide flippase family protein [Methylocystis echinoides]|uniref:lipopolysaccharide biosynthesis protein n=1 Tax=Methylocystis echinoides TaxID=29468 RepID=UPI00343C5A9C
MISRDRIKQRMLGGFVAHFGSRVWLIVARLVEAPLFLSYWGRELWGEWLMLTAIAEYVSLSQIGVSDAVRNEVVMAVARGDTNSATKSLHTTQSVLIVLSGVALILVCAVVSLDLSRHLHITNISEASAKFVIIFSSIQAAIRLQAAIPQATLSASGYYPLSTTLSVCGSIIAFVPSVILVPLEFGPASLAVAQLLAAILELSAFWGVTLYLSRWARFGVICNNYNELRRIALPAIKMASFNVGQMLNTQGYRIIVGLVLGPSALSSVTVVRTFCQTLTQGGTMISQVFHPELAAAQGRGDLEDFRKLAHSCLRWSAWVGFVIFLIATLFGEKFIFFWTNGKVKFGMEALFLPLLATLMDAVWRSAMIPAYATNRAGKIGFVFLVTFGFGFLFATYFFSYIGGIKGALAALLLPQLVMTFAVFFIVPPICGDSGFFWFKIMLSPPIDLEMLKRRIASWI